jgi:hypothetical protein
VDWLHLAQNRDQWRARAHGNQPLDFIKGREFLNLNDC